MKRTLNQVSAPLSGWLLLAFFVVVGVGTLAIPPPALAAPGDIATVAGGFLGDNGPAISARLSSPAGVAVDAGGNIYLADTVNNRVRKVDGLTGVITTVAGNGSMGYWPGDDGVAATSVGLSSPDGIALDSAGNLYIADNWSNRILKVDGASGIITTVVGSGTYGCAGDGGPAIFASLGSPRGVAVDGAGNIYIADTNCHVLRKVAAATGIITTVAGNGTAGFSGDGGPAVAAELNGASAVAVDGEGNISIVDRGNLRIRQVAAATGIITTVAGNGTAGYVSSDEGGPATSAVLGSLDGLGLDGAGNIYIASDNRVRKVDAATGTITTVAGNGVAGYSGDGGSAELANLDSPSGVAVDGAGNIYIGGDHRIRKVDGATGIITTVAGSGGLGDGGLATSAVIDGPDGVAVDGAGNIYIADCGNNRIRKVDASTGVITTVAGNGSVDYLPGDGGVATAAGMGPAGLAADSAGNLYVADFVNQRIRKVAAATGVITTVAGNGHPGYSRDGGLALSASLNYPTGVAVDRSGNLYIADQHNNRIRKVAAASGVITTVAGNGTAGYAGDGGPATWASLDYPTGVTVDGLGNLYIADQRNNRIRKIVASTGTIMTVAGDGTGDYSGDGGPARAAALWSPTGVAVDGAGNIYIAEIWSNRIRKVDVSTGIIVTVAGSEAIGYATTDDGAPATQASLNGPGGVAVDGAGNIYIADTWNNRIRMVDALSVSNATADSVANAPGSKVKAVSPGGTITGMVTYNGNPVVNMAVYASDTGATGNYGSAFTDATGNYIIVDLAAGSYKVSFDGPSAGYISQYYNNAPDAASATPVSVTIGATTSGIDAALALGGSITGRVTYNGNPVANLAVYASAGTAGIGITDSAGNYSIAGLPAGSYLVSFDGPSSGYTAQWYNNATDAASATLVTVAIGVATTGIDAALLQGGSITGRVTYNGNPVANMAVYANDTTAAGASGGAFTDSVGNYKIAGLPARSYRVYFDGPSVGCNVQYYNNVPDAASATPVSVTVGVATTGIDAALVLGGSITGRVTYNGNPVANMAVYAYATTPTGTSAGAFTDAAGNYAIKGLPAGSYQVSFDGPSAGCLVQWYNNAPDQASATPVSVSIGVTASSINAALARGGSISGKVTYNGNPVVNIAVYAYNAATGNSTGNAFTDGSGNYVISGLPDGSYKVGFDGSSAGYFNQWYSNAPDMAGAASLTVTADMAASGIDAALVQSGGSISGKVTYNGSPAVNIGVYAYDVGTGNSAGSAVTDGSGNYTISGLTTGSYKVSFAGQNAGYAAQWYNNAPDAASASPVSVTTGVATVGVNAAMVLAASNVVTFAVTLDPGGTISPSGDIGVLIGEDRTFNLKPDLGYRVAEVIVDGVSIGASNTLKFKHLTENHSIKVRFVRLP